MRPTSKAWKCGLCALGLALLAGTGAGAPPRPNVLFILCDDLGYGDLGVFFQNARAAAGNRNQPWHLTPHLDTLAADGVQLRHHYCPAPVCAPSRASLLLGVHQGHANVRDNQFDKALADNHTLATVLRGAGYTTALIGKYGLQGTGSPAAAHPRYRGFDYFYGLLAHTDGHLHYSKEDGGHTYEDFTEVTAGLDLCYSTDLFTARAKRWLTDHAATNAAQPFFMYLAYDVPHARLQIPTQVYPAGFGTTGGVQWVGTTGAMINTASGTRNSWVHPDYSAATWDDDANGGTPEVAWPTYAKYHATMVRRLDDAVADLRQTLADLNLASNTLVVFTSDNGTHNEAGSGGTVTYNPTFFDSFAGFDGIKRDCWEGGIRVGALACWPDGIPAGGVSTRPSGFWDWLPTFAELAGVPAPARTDGVSLVPALTGVGTSRASRIYIEYYVNNTTPTYTEFEVARRGRTRNQLQALRLGDYLGVRYNIANHTNDFEIYDVAADPKQITNLAAGVGFAALQEELKDTVLRLRRPDSSAARPYDSEPVPAVTGVLGAAGCHWQAFTNTTPWVPDTAGLAPMSTGVTARPAVDVRPRDSNFVLRFTGYLNVPATGDYTFHLTAGGGAVWRLHEATVIDADFGYVAGTETTGTIRLAAGRHPYTLTLRQGPTGTPALVLAWSGPALPKVVISNSVFTTDDPLTPGPPVAVDDVATTRQATPVDIAVLANDLDDGAPQPLAIASAGPAGGGNCVITNGLVRYQPQTNFLGRDRFTYAVTDGGATATAAVVVDVHFWNPAALWFPFNQTGGLVTAESGGSPIGLLTGVTNPGAAWVAGPHGRALALAGSNEHVVVSGFPGVLGTTARTVAAWIRTTATNGAIVGWGTRDIGGKWSLIIEASGRLRQEVESGYAIGTAVVTNGAWHHVAVTLPAGGNATSVQFYVNGLPDTRSAVSARAVNTLDGGNLMIGRDNQDRYFRGALDEVRVYQRALSAAEIAELASAGQQCAAAWWRRYYGDASPDWLSDTEGDGSPALLEYGWGGQPHLPSSDLRLGLRSSGTPRAVYRRRPAGLHDLTYQPEAAAALPGPWDQPVAESLVTPVEVGGDAFEEVEVAPAAPLTNSLLRVQVRLP
jgi:arylsulfatase A-like enzyme